MQHNHFSKKILNVSTSDATKFCSTNGLPATHYFNQICGCFQCKFCSINGLPATHYFRYICYYLLLFCKQILFHKRIASNPLFIFHKRVAGKPLFQPNLLLFAKQILFHRPRDMIFVGIFFQRLESRNRHMRVRNFLEANL